MPHNSSAGLMYLTLMSAMVVDLLFLFSCEALDWLCELCSPFYAALSPSLLNTTQGDKFGPKCTTSPKVIACMSRWQVWFKIYTSPKVTPDIMKSTKVQTLRVLTRVRDIYIAIVCTWSNIMRMRSDKMATTGISRTMVEAL